MKKWLIILVALYLICTLFFPTNLIGDFLHIKPHHLEHKIAVFFSINFLIWALCLFIIITYRTWKRKAI
ncbi:hypothetical protein DS745_02520 [Anaerobacillus alkaliphilus]|uniref:Uncharacterized protein n=1 Tax=Anaerobacillus alkaliphilus TaxID=1548597 RepID=A0A4Q0VX08_9BACI|nr:hypothetical protein DS745_02520 [Anaerobacillus alkaliphilus]